MSRTSQRATSGTRAERRPVERAVDSTVSTDRPSDILRPWHFFAALALLSAAVGALRANAGGPTAIIFMFLALLAAGWAGLAAYGVVYPLCVAEPVAGGNRPSYGRVQDAYESVVRAIAELEFDRQMGKISEAAFVELRVPLEKRQARLLQRLQAGPSGYRDTIERDLRGRLAQGAETSTAVRPATQASSGMTGAGDLRMCPACHTPNDTDALFCKRCGGKLMAAS